MFPSNSIYIFTNIKNQRRQKEKIRGFPLSDALSDPATFSQTQNGAAVSLLALTNFQRHPGNCVYENSCLLLDSFYWLLFNLKQPIATSVETGLEMRLAVLLESLCR
jgi:hypothetical protein